LEYTRLAYSHRPKPFAMPVFFFVASIPRAIRRASLFLFLLILCVDAQGQSEVRAGQPSAGGQADSLAIHFQRKADYYRRADSLAAWLYCYWDWQAEVFEDSRQALSILDTARRLAWRSPRSADEAEALLWLETNRGYHLFQLGKVLASAQAYEAALAWYQAYPGLDFEALDYLYLPLGAHYIRLGDNEKARALYEGAISRHAGGERDGALAGLYNNLGLTYWNEGDYARAIAVYEKGLAGKGVPPIKAALLHLSLGQSLLDSGRLPAATQAADAALGLLRRLESLDPDLEALPDYLAGAYLLRARLLREAGQNELALVYLRRALAYAHRAWRTPQHRDIAKIWLEFGASYLRAGAPRRALAAFNQALAGLLPGFPADSLEALPHSGRLYAENSLFQALEGKADALWAIYQEAPRLADLRLALECHRLAGLVEAELWRWLGYESSKINLAAQRRKRLGKAIELARRLYEAGGDEAWLYRGWTYAEQAKSALLLEAVRRNHLDHALAKGDETLRLARRLRQQAAYFERNLLLTPDSPLRVAWLSQRDSLLRQSIEVEALLTRRYPAWTAWRESAEGFDAAAIRALRQAMPRYTILEYFAGETHIELFCQAPAGAARWWRIDTPDSLAAQARRFLEMLRSRSAAPSIAAYGALAHHLHARLLAPALEASPAGLTEVLIVPDAWLAMLPFEAFWLAPSTDGGWEKAPFALRRHAIHYAFSLAVLDAQRRSPARGGRDISQLAPRFAARERGLAPLVYSHEEAPVRWLCGDRRFLDEAADFARLRQAAERYRVVHLSTHAGAEAENLPPRVELHDRSIYLPDIYALRIPAELVALSACQTATGTFHAGEGTMSLARAFAYAGAKGLAASLWTINEASTAYISRRFHANLRAGAAKPAALRAAKIAYLDDPEIPAFQKTPYYWAGLIYLGEEGAIKWSKCPLRVAAPLSLLALALLALWKGWSFFRSANGE
jgi:CHAT domain-containing protein